MPDLAVWAARKLKPDGGLLLVYTGHHGLLEVGGEIAKKLTYVWTLACHNGDGVKNTHLGLKIRCCWRPILMFSRGRYRPEGVFDDALISSDREKSYYDYQQPLSEAVFYVKALTRPKSTICDPFLGSGTTACAVARLGEGRKFVGSEIDPDTCKIARNRVAEEIGSGGAAAIPAAKAATR